MRVTFTKAGDKRYSVAIERDQGPPLVPRFGPGHDDLMPHDIAHYLVEEYFRIELGVWGQLAAGGGGLFTPAPEDNTMRYQRRARRVAAIGREDMARSEHLVMVTVSAWERSAGRAAHQAPPVAVDVGADVGADTLRGMVGRMDEVSRRWQALPRGGSMTFTWPRELTFDPARSRRGRRPTRRSTAAVRR